ncbi:MAG: class I SAM-dependent methyltransferase [Dehalococcoidia bacterium]
MAKDTVDTKHLELAEENITYEIDEEAYIGTSLYRELERDAIADFIKHGTSPDGLSILDIGTRDGVMLDELLRRDVGLGRGPIRLVGMDFARAPLVASRASGRSRRLELVQAAGEHVPFSQETFGVVICAFGVYSYVHQPELMHEVHRVLHPDGIAVFTAYNREGIVRSLQLGSGGTDAVAVRIDKAGRNLIIPGGRRISLFSLPDRAQFGRELEANGFDVLGIRCYPSQILMRTVAETKRRLRPRHLCAGKTCPICSEPFSPSDRRRLKQSEVTFEKAQRRAGLSPYGLYLIALTRKAEAA